MKKSLLILLALIICNLSFAEKVPVPELRSPVTDLTNTLSDSEIKNIESKLILFEESGTGQIAILLLHTTGEESIEEYSIRLAEKWKIGSSENDDGIILLVAKNDRKLRIEVGYGLESTITDAEAQYIIDNLITPDFKKGEFYNGINNGIDRIIGLITGALPTIDELSESYSIKSTESSTDWSQDPLVLILFTIISLAIFVPFFLIKSKLSTMIIFLLCLFGTELFMGYFVGDLSVAWIFMMVTAIFIFIPFLMNVIGTITGYKKDWDFSSSGSSSSGGWSSSSSSGSWSSSSSSSSYSGGGGGFGGGGASGSW